MFTVRGCVIQTLRSMVSTFVNMIYNIYCFTPGKFDSIVQKCDVDLCERVMFTGNGLLAIKYISHLSRARIVLFTFKGPHFALTTDWTVQHHHGGE